MRVEGSDERAPPFSHRHRLYLGVEEVVGFVAGLRWEAGEGVVVLVDGPLLLLRVASREASLGLEGCEILTCSLCSRSLGDRLEEGQSL